MGERGGDGQKGGLEEKSKLFSVPTRSFLPSLVAPKLASIFLMDEGRLRRQLDLSVFLPTDSGYPDVRFRH